MIEGRINLYSDTQTRPTPEMKAVMLDAPMGDEQHMLDPSVNALCDYVANLLGMEAAVFMPSGTMCNEIAILVHCRPGDEAYAHKTAHILGFEGGGPAALAGINIFPLEGPRGVFGADALAAAIRPESRYFPRSRLLSVEQTSNLGGGKIWPLESIRAVRDVAKAHGLVCHMDGARLMNAVVASGVPAADFAAGFDSAWIDLSKALGCPIGGVLAGSQGFIDEAWRWKQRMGGALRQAGMLAAAGLYAFEHHLDKIAQDHINAKRLAEIIGSHELIDLSPADIESNLVFIDISKTGIPSGKIVAELEAQGINMGGFGETTMRAVTHLDVSAADIEEAGEAFLNVVNHLSGK